MYFLKKKLIFKEKDISNTKNNLDINSGNHSQNNSNKIDLNSNYNIDKKEEGALSSLENPTNNIDNINLDSNKPVNFNVSSQNIAELIEKINLEKSKLELEKEKKQLENLNKRKFWGSIYRFGNNINKSILFLIIGGIFVFNNLGVLSWNIWLDILQFWPIIILLFGINAFLNITIYTKAISPLVNLSVLVIVIITSFVINTTKIDIFPYWICANSLKRESYSFVDKKENNNEQILKNNYILSINGNRLKLNDSSEEPFYIKLNEHFSLEKTPLIYIDKKNNEKTLKFTDKAYTCFFNNPVLYNVNLENNNLTDLDLTLNASSTQINLNNIKLNKIKIVVNASNVQVFIKNTDFLKDIDIELNFGKIDFYLPNNTLYINNYEIFAGNLKIGNDSINSINTKGNFISNNTKIEDKKVNISTKILAGDINFIVKQ